MRMVIRSRWSRLRNEQDCDLFGLELDIRDLVTSAVDIRTGEAAASDQVTNTHLTLQTTDDGCSVMQLYLSKFIRKVSSITQ
mgnify:CR=1 FL=1